MDNDKLAKVIEGLKVCTNPATKRGCLDGICPYDGKGCRGAMERDALELLKEQQEKIHQLESKNVSASGNGTAIGVLHGGMTIKKEYHQQAKEVYNIGHIDRLDL